LKPPCFDCSAQTIATPQVGPSTAAVIMGSLEEEEDRDMGGMTIRQFFVPIICRSIPTLLITAIP
jgi:hypothetical protein